MAAIKTKKEAIERGKKTQFQKGKSGNPAGSPKKIPVLDILLADILSEEKGGITAAAAIIKALLSKATKGDVRAAEVLLDRAYGKTKQSIIIEDAIKIIVSRPK